MSKTLTPRELLNQNREQTLSESVLEIEADLPLVGEVLDSIKKLLTENSSIAGLEVLTIEEKTLGFISREALFDYIKVQLLERMAIRRRLGGRVSELEGSVISPVPLFQCDHYATPYHQDPPYQRLVSIARPGLKCRRCGKDLQRVK